MIPAITDSSVIDIMSTTYSQAMATIYIKILQKTKP